MINHAFEQSQRDLVIQAISAMTYEEGPKKKTGIFL